MYILVIGAVDICRFRLKGPHGVICICWLKGPKIYALLGLIGPKKLYMYMLVRGALDICRFRLNGPHGVICICWLKGPKIYALVC